MQKQHSFGINLRPSIIGKVKQTKTYFIKLTQKRIVIADEAMTLVSKFYFVLILNFSFLVAFAQPPEYKLTPKEYIEKFKDDAVKEMLLHQVPASITIAQGMLESGNGNSALAVYANNHFGIKCHKDWEGKTFIQDDDTKDECFRKYPTVLDSYSDHSQFLRSRSRYMFLFELKTTDYKGWAYGLKNAGYATDPKYAERLIELIEGNQLYQYDKLLTTPIEKESEKNFAKPLIAKSSARIVSLNNDRKFVIAKEGDSFLKIATEFEMGLWELYKYNELEKNASLKGGDIVFLQPKKNKAKKEFHSVQKGETLHTISQKHCVKMKKLLKYNNLKYGQEPPPGDTLNLRKKRRS